jgi:hypothetical protein
MSLIHSVIKVFAVLKKKKKRLVLSPVCSVEGWERWGKELQTLKGRLTDSADREREWT